MARQSIGICAAPAIDLIVAVVADLSVYVELLRSRSLDDELLQPLFAVIRAEGVVITANQSKIVALLVDGANATVIAPLARGFALMRSHEVARVGSSPQLLALQSFLLDDEWFYTTAPRQTWSSADDAGAKPRLAPLIAAGVTASFIETGSQRVMSLADPEEEPLDPVPEDDGTGVATEVLGFMADVSRSAAVPDDGDADAKLVLYCGRLISLLAMCGTSLSPAWPV